MTSLLPNVRRSSALFPRNANVHLAAWFRAQRQRGWLVAPTITEQSRPHRTSSAEQGPGGAREAPEEKVKREAKGQQAQALYEPEMPRDRAAATLGKFVGIPDLSPGEVVTLDAEQIHGVLKAAPKDRELERALFSHANGVSNRFFGNEVYYRGIVEFSNVCQSDCGYCGIRKHQPGVHRYTMTKEEVLEAALWAYKHNYGSLMLQSGELNTPQRLQYLLDVIKEIRTKTVELEEAKEETATTGAATSGGTIPTVPTAPVSGPQGVQEAAARLASQGVPVGAEEVGKRPVTEKWQRRQKGLCVALSVGELEKEKYQQLFDAGATRYLLRIETSNPTLFASLHPPKQTFEGRLQCLMDLKEVGFQLGTGIMVGLPGQTLRDLAQDIVFFRQIGANMIGMGPYITEEDTPVAEMWKEAFPGAVLDKTSHMEAMFQLTTRMVALARITLGNANVTATTALQAINPVGREIALRRGANVLMPILTPTQFREDYQLYEGKPCITDTADECRRCLGVRIGLVGKRVQPGIWADPPNFIHPVVTPATPFGARVLHTSAAQSTMVASPYLLTSTVRQPRQVPAFESQLARTACSLSNISGNRRGGHRAAGLDLVGPGNGLGPLIGNGRRGLATQSKKLGGASPSDIPRVNVGLFGAMNAGKSTLINCITMQETSIVDATPGTTADTKIATMELHDVGPVKLFDTAGIDESGELGAKKRSKALDVLKECDVAMLVINPLLPKRNLEQALAWERSLVELAQRREKDLVLVFNTRRHEVEAANLSEDALSKAVKDIALSLDPSRKLPCLLVDLGGPRARLVVTDFLQDRIRVKQGQVLPSIPTKYLTRDSMVFLNIPMDAETPGSRLLRPQAMVQEEVLRHFGTTLAFRMDLAAARGTDARAKQDEKERFRDALRSLLAHQGPKLMVTDSQAMDVVHPWTVDEATGLPLVDLTTFSIAMIQRQTNGQLHLLVDGLQAYQNLKPGDRVLVAEACNHNRITELCNDIATVQIPEKMAQQNPAGGVHLDHAFGREFPDLAATSVDGLGQYALAIHCGGCMVDRQKILARIEDLKEAGVPVTNFGLLLSYAAAPQALWRVVEPYGLKKLAHANS